MQSNVLQNAPIEHSAIRLLCTKIPLVFKTFVLSIFERRLKTGAICNSCLISYSSSFVSFYRDLSNNILGTIQGEIFGGSSSIGENLNLQNNSLTYININAFDNVALTYIMLTDNLLTVYPQALLSQNPERM